jgi:5-methylcytosine-specific restriction endonuclease McrA
MPSFASSSDIPHPRKETNNPIRDYTGKPARKAKIPKALREQVWRTYNGKTAGEAKCFVTWCTNRVTTFDFEVGHNMPESKGGATALPNLRPICSRCNKSMGNNYTIEEWNKMSPAPTTGCCCLIC